MFVKVCVRFVFCFFFSAAVGNSSGLAVTRIFRTFEGFGMAGLCSCQQTEKESSDFVPWVHAT